MVKWPRSRRIHVTIAFAAAVLAGLQVLAIAAMASFNNFYFAPHKAYPYPYPTEKAAHIVLSRSGCLTFVAVFLGVYGVQRLLIRYRNNSSSF